MIVGHASHRVNLGHGDITGTRGATDAYLGSETTVTVYIWSMSAPEPAESRKTWWARLTTIVAASVLVLLGVAYVLSHEPSVRVGVRWRDAITMEHRARLERRFRLVNGVSEKGHDRYDLLDTRPDNIEALMNNPAVEDTESMNRVLPPDISYGESWMWVAHRIPGLRAPGVVEALVMTCVVALGAGVARLTKGRRMWWKG